MRYPSEHKPVYATRAWVDDRVVSCELDDGSVFGLPARMHDHDASRKVCYSSAERKQGCDSDGCSCRRGQAALNTVRSEQEAAIVAPLPVVPIERKVASAVLGDEPFGLESAAALSG